MIYWFVYWFMFPSCIVIVAFAMLLGIDGTAIFTPLVILLFPLLRVPFISPADAIAVGLLTEFFGFLSGLIGYKKERLIDFKTGWSLIMVGVPVIIVFSIIAQFVSGVLLKLIFGVMLLSIAIYLSVTAKSTVRNRYLTILPPAVSQIPRTQESPRDSEIVSGSGKEYRYRVCDRKRGFLISGIGSALEGMISVGLGELLMPDLVRRCKIPVGISAATSVFVMTLVVLAGSVTDIFTLLARGGADAIPWNLIIFTIPGAVLGGQIGAKLQGRLSSSNIEKLIALMFILIGTAFLYESILVLF